jgi:hypothetical protein
MSAVAPTVSAQQLHSVLFRTCHKAIAPTEQGRKQASPSRSMQESDIY